jgi:3-hydroxyacyl-CoA dehydrogenase / enoyl-CoA hydratase / 3-hydroxybutyryl-CoA epimerase
LGMPVGPLALADEVGIDVLHHVVHFFRDRERGRWADDKHWSGNELIDRLYGEHRYGRKTGRGFYEYAPAGTKQLDRALAQASGRPSVSDVKERLLYAQLVEAVRCWADGVVDDVLEADLGAHLGWAFPSYLGGPFRYVDQVGVAKFAQRCAELTECYGARFEPPEKLSLLATAGGSLHASAREELTA